MDVCLRVYICLLQILHTQTLRVVVVLLLLLLLCCCCCVTGSGFDSTSPVFMKRTARLHRDTPGWPPNKGNQTPIVGCGRDGCSLYCICGMQ